MGVAKNIIYICSILLLLNFDSLAAENKITFKEISVGDQDAPIKIEIYSSLTCPHCANFHKKIYPKIKKEYVDNNLALIVFKDFPLDIAALNASKLLQCVDNNQKLPLLNVLYEKQNIWAEAKDIESINSNLLNIVQKFGLDKNYTISCINNSHIEDSILNSRIDASKKYEINSTPTIIINGKKVEGPINFKSLKKIIEKII